MTTAPDYDMTPRSDIGKTPRPTLLSMQHIPDTIRKMIDKHTHKEGWRTGLNEIPARHWEQFAAYMLMSGAMVEGEDIFVPQIPGETKPRTQIGLNKCINVSDLNIYFGRVGGAYGIPEGS